MSVRIYEGKQSGDIVVWTTCLNAENFLLELSEAIAQLPRNNGDREVRIYQTLQRAAPLLFKLSGYKADEVHEQRTLFCGAMNPEGSTIIGKGGADE